MAYGRGGVEITAAEGLVKRRDNPQERLRAVRRLAAVPR